jgi:hypothetical protein
LNSSILKSVLFLINPWLYLIAFKITLQLQDQIGNAKLLQGFEEVFTEEFFICCPLVFLSLQKRSRRQKTEVIFPISS